MAQDHQQTFLSFNLSFLHCKGAVLFKFSLAEIKGLAKAIKLGSFLLEPRFRVNRKRNKDNKFGKESYLFSPVSLVPIIEYGHQQSRSVD